MNQPWIYMCSPSQSPLPPPSPSENPTPEEKWFRAILIPNCKKSWWRTLFGPMESGSYYWTYNWPKKHTAYKNRRALLLTVLFSVVLKKTGVFPEARKEFMIRKNNSKKHLYFLVIFSLLLKLFLPLRNPDTYPNPNYQLWPIMQFNDWECFPEVLYPNFVHSSLSLKATKPLFNRVNFSFLIF